MGCICATMAGWTLGSARFLFPNVLSEPPNKVKVGEPGNFEDGKVVDAFKDRNMWIVKYQGKIYALSTTCTHLGCTPNWLEADKKFKCPCHGSGYLDRRRVDYVLLGRTGPRLRAGDGGARRGMRSRRSSSRSREPCVVGPLQWPMSGRGPEGSDPALDNAGALHRAGVRLALTAGGDAAGLRDQAILAARSGSRATRSCAP